MERSREMRKAFVMRIAWACWVKIKQDFFLHLRRGGVLSPPDLGPQGQQFSTDRKTAKCRLKSRMLPLFFSEIPTPEKPNGNSLLPAMKIEHLAKAWINIGFYLFMLLISPCKHFINNELLTYHYRKKGGILYKKENIKATRNVIIASWKKRKSWKGLAAVSPDFIMVRFLKQADQIACR